MNKQKVVITPVLSTMLHGRALDGWDILMVVPKSKYPRGSYGTMTLIVEGLGYVLLVGPLNAIVKLTSVLEELFHEVEILEEEYVEVNNDMS